MTKRSIYFIVVFSFLGLIVLRIPISSIIGSDKSFTLFDYLGPTTGMFLGPTLGATSVFLVKLINILTGGEEFTWLSLLRFLPMMMAAVYLGSKTRKMAIVPLICLFLFIAHPEGRAAWYYSLYWLIPIISVFLKKRFFFNALGSTFTAHAIGSVIFLYAFNLPATVWISLIPIVAVERFLFTLGIWISYPAINTLLDLLQKKFNFNFFKPVVKSEYIYSKKFFKEIA